MFTLAPLRRNSGHKQHYCLYCGLLTFKMPRHLENNHKEEALVIKATLCAKGSTERRMALREIVGQEIISKM